MLKNDYTILNISKRSCNGHLVCPVLGVANSSVRHTRPEARGHPWQRAADGGPHLTAMSCLFFPAASFARDSPLSYSEIDPHACAQLHLQQDRLLQQTSSTVLAGFNSTASNTSWIQQRRSSWGFQSSHTSRSAFETSFIGSQFASGPSSRSACSFGTAWSALPRPTSRNSASPFPPAPVVGAFDQRADGTLWSLERILLDSGGVVSLCLGRPSGSPYRRRFGKPWTMLNCLRRSWKHSTCRLQKQNWHLWGFISRERSSSINQSI